MPTDATPPPAGPPSYITVDVSPLAGAVEARVWSNDRQQWWDFSASAFSDSPKQIGAVLEPNAKNPFQRRTPFVQLPPGDYRVYAVPRDNQGRPLGEFDSVTVHEVPAEPRDRPVLNIAITQPAR